MIIKISPLLFCVLTLASFHSNAFADPDNTDTSSNTNGVNRPGKASHNLSKVKIATPGGDKEAPVEIQGFCSIVPSASNPLAGPCVNVVVILNHEDGSTFVKNRTTAQGTFSFEAENGQKYQLALGSALYEIVYPKTLVQAGQKVDLRIQQK